MKRWSWAKGRAVPKPRTPEQIEREQVEWVFGLTGGELADEPWRPLGADGTAWVFPYWHDGVPEYAEADFDDVYEATYRTVVCDDTLPDVVIDADDGASWQLVKFYSNYGETECPRRQADDPADGLPCDLCGEDDEHGVIYFSDRWGETVYKQDELDDEDND